MPVAGQALAGRIEVLKEIPAGRKSGMVFKRSKRPEGSCNSGITNGSGFWGGIRKRQLLSARGPANCYSRRRDGIL